MTLAVERLSVALGGLQVVEDATLVFPPGQVHALVGESGSGKTVLASAVMGLLPAGATISGTATLDGAALLDLGPTQRRPGLAMVLQERLAALDPVQRLGAQLRETLEVHGAGGPGWRARAVALLAEVGVPAPEERLAFYAHQLSGGLCQRAAIALALAASPRVLIADEPTTALDASLRGVILQLLRRLARERGLAVWLITHDLHAVRDACDRVTVLYAGRVVEQGRVDQVVGAPRHPYTAALLRAHPARSPVGEPLPALAGAVPSPGEAIPGCRFHPRCARAAARCRSERPSLEGGVACFAPEAPAP